LLNAGELPNELIKEARFLYIIYMDISLSGENKCSRHITFLQQTSFVKFT